MRHRLMSKPQRQLKTAILPFSPSWQRRAIATSQSPRFPKNPLSTPRNRHRVPSTGACRQLATHSHIWEGHKLPVLVHGETYEQHGIDGLLSLESFDLAWTQYQSFLLEKLNEMTLATVDATMHTRSLTEKYAFKSEKASLFNHASMAFNNHDFFSNLSPRKTEPSTNFLKEIKDSFGSYDTLKMEMIETADAMFGPGFVWIVKDADVGRMHLLCTYLAGTPLPGAHARAQPIDSATRGGPRLGGLLRGEPTNSAGTFGNFSRTGSDIHRPASTYNARPILCVNTWQHVYLRDYGIAGKRQYLERWWDRIDWELVEKNARGQHGQHNRNLRNIINRHGRSF